MVEKMDQRLGEGHLTQVLEEEPRHMESVRTKRRQVGPHSEEPPQRQPVS